MGNTGTGDAPDTGAVFFNPAGLAYLPGNKLSVSGSTFMQYDIKYASIENLNPGSVPYDTSGLNTIPSTYVSAMEKWGWHFAFSILVPSSLDIENRTDIVSPQISGEAVQSLNQKDLWVGISAAHEIDSHWALGCSLFGVDHSQSEVIQFVNIFSSLPNTNITETQFQKYSVYGALLLLGVSYRPNEKWSFGYRFQGPFWQATQTNNSYQSSIATISGTSTPVTSEDSSNQMIRYQTPPDMTWGAAVKPADWWEILGDISLQLPINYSSMPNFSLNQNFNTDATFRYNFGMDFSLSKSMHLLAGGYYNPSTIHRLTSAQVGNTQLNARSGTIGVKWTMDHVETGLGGFYTYLNGQTMNSDGTTPRETAKAYGGLLISSFVF